MTLVIMENPAFCLTCFQDFPGKIERFHDFSSTQMHNNFYLKFAKETLNNI